jgi:hypothetical protein
LKTQTIRLKYADKARRNVFRGNNFICTRIGEDSRLVVWLKAQDCLGKQLELEKEYPDCAELFRCILAAQKIDIKDLVSDAKKISQSSSLETVRQLLLDISDSLQGMDLHSASTAVKELRRHKILPTLETQKTSETHVFWSSQDRGDWFIADREHLRERFVELVPLLAFDVGSVQRADTLPKALEVDSRKLSDLVMVTSLAKGRINLHGDYSRMLRSKAWLISR